MNDAFIKSTEPASIADRIANLSAAKKALLQLKLEGKSTPGLNMRIIHRQADRAPLSFAQQRLWFLDRWETGSSLYNVPRILRISGPLNLKALSQSLNEIVRRHQSLRASFVEDRGQPVQRIASDASIELPVTSLEHLPPDHRDPEARRLAFAEAAKPFDLTRGPLFRAALFRLTDSEHIFVLTMHHIVTDGWSMGVFFHELAILYQAFSSQRPSPLPDLPIQYADFALWQRQWLQGEILNREIQHWKKRLDGLALLDLPTDRPRPPVLSYCGARLDFTLPAQLLLDLKTLGRQEGVTLFMLLFAAFQTLLHRYTGQKDIAAGSVIANRNQTEIENLIGFFVNTLVLRTNFDRNPTFRQLLLRVRKVALDAFAHQDLPYEKIVEELKPERDPSRNPLFQVMFVLQNAPDPQPALAGLRLEPIPEDTRTAKFDLTLFLTEVDSQLHGSFEYSTDLFDPSTIQRMAGHLQTLLLGIVANPDQLLSDLPILTPDERHRLLVEWNDTASQYPRDACIHHLFEAQAEHTPDAIAAAFEDQKLSYRQLNARANQLARYLRSRGIGPDVPVGISIERSLDMPVALLAILKAGGAYVPLDPDYPRERLAFMAQDTAIKFLLTQNRLSAKLAAAVPDLLCLDDADETLAAESDRNLPPAARPDNLAYVIYTSGSTGVPKGVAIPHRGVVRLVMNSHYARLDPNETFLQLAPLSFDASTFEIWAPLLHGARCVLHPPGVPSPELLADAIQRHRISTLWLTASLFNLVVDQAPWALRGISQLLIGGEPLSTPHVHRALEHLNGTRIINGYGPTESTTFTCCYAIPHDIPPDISLPIGKPIANTQVYVLDPQHNPVPVGIPGELFIAGDGLARGYVNRPDLTAEKFLPNPFSPHPAARMYKTGDLVRFRPDGNIEFLGRLDHQVKIRGFRIEPGEIETVLGQHPAVRLAAVIAREDVPGDRRLAAYVLQKPDAGTTLTAAELRRFLQQKLPDYMVPSVFVFMDRMPLTPSGKVNRIALPAPDRTRPNTGAGYIAPRTPTEETLARIWAELLGLERVGIHDSFFELGGHSLLAVQLFSKIADQFGKKLSLSDLFRAPSIESIAKALAQDALPGSFSSIVEIRSTGTRAPLYVFHDLGGEAMLAVKLADYLGEDQPVYGFYHGSAISMSKRESRLEDLAARYVADLIAFQPKGPYCLAGYSFGGHLAYEAARQLTCRGHRVGHLAIIDTNPTFKKSASFKSYAFAALRFMQNTPLWLWEILVETHPVEVGRRIQRKARQTCKWLKRGILLGKLPAISANIEDIFDVQTFPGDYVQVMEYHLDLLHRYQPTAYNGPITVYRAKTRPLLHAQEWDLGWGALAHGPIDVIPIPGNHDTLVREPNIQLLAGALRSAIEKLGSHEAASSIKGHDWHA